MSPDERTWFRSYDEHRTDGFGEVDSSRFATRIVFGEGEFADSQPIDAQLPAYERAEVWS